jgi:peroxiredoxin
MEDQIFSKPRLRLRQKWQYGASSRILLKKTVMMRGAAGACTYTCSAMFFAARYPLH